MPIKHCEACGIELHMTANAATGKYLPLQKIKSVYIVQDGVAVVVEPPKGPMETQAQRYISHFETCPDATKFSRRRRG